MLFKIINGAVDLGSETVLEEINFEIKDKEKIAIVGRNGAGKSTLLRVVTGEIELSEGIGEEKKNLISSGAPVIGYLKQNAFTDESATMLDEILHAYDDVIAVEKEMERLSQKLLTDQSDGVVKAYSDACDKFEFLGGYVYKKEYESAIKKFGFTEEDKSKAVSEFSGGQRTRIALIKLILSRPDILLLDEPTNHLDVEAIEWLQEYLRNYKKSIVLVSHDRMFLDKIVNVVYEIEYGATTRYSGNYTAFQRIKKENYEKQLRDYEAQSREIDRLRRIADRFRYKPTKASMALSKLKQIERMNLVDAPNRYDLRTFHANFQPKEESVKDVFLSRGLKVGYESVLAEIDLSVSRGEKIGIIGANGIGKSTFLKTIVGRLDKLDGTFLWGVRTSIGYFDQQMAHRASEKSVFDDFYDEFPSANETEVRNSLGAFGFSGEDVFKPVSVLSGGEKVRLALCKILKRRPNVLVLDEPTNHMDIVGKETLEDMLVTYDGTVFVVSHDRYLINKVADKILVFDERSVRLYDCGYERYLELRDEERAREEKSEKIVENTRKPAKTYYNPLKERQKRKKRLDKLTALIAQKEREIEDENAKLLREDVYSDYEKCQEIQSKVAELESELDAFETEYLTLCEEI